MNPNRYCDLFILIALFLGTFSCQSIHAQIASALAREGAVLDGDSSGRVVENIFYNSINGVGGYAFRIQMSNSVDYYWGNATGGSGATLRAESVIGNYSQNFLSFFGISDSGQLGYSAPYNNSATGETNLRGPWRDSELLLPEGNSIPGITGKYSIGIGGASITRSGNVYWEGQYSNTRNGAKQGDAIFYGDASTVILKTGDSLGGIAEVVSDNIFAPRFSAFGTNYIAKVELDTGVDSEYALVSNGSVLTAGGGLLREGSEISGAAGGQTGELYENLSIAGRITESGEYLVTGDSNADESLNSFLMVNGQIVLREGDVFGGSSLTGTVESSFMNENGDWAVVWGVQDGSGGEREALIVNGNLVLLEGDAVDWNNDGLIDSMDQGASLLDFTSAGYGLTLSDRDSNGQLRLMFIADANVAGAIREGGFSFTYSAVPEPGTIGLLTLALLGTLYPRNRQRIAVTRSNP